MRTEGWEGRTRRWHLHPMRELLGQLGRGSQVGPGEAKVPGGLPCGDQSHGLRLRLALAIQILHHEDRRVGPSSALRYVP
eukprot:CAMPEP_0170582562 /NCGR_PEP_ID=MMETSP0224-20130122/7654_1 /TAXON_ID=285029 /ORGANISM="Togula jolla, Strain CCCM 725" /LENGTH=79 /DNA_ID=CAMNT_0010905803 /DNA_START=250 /DNA_END=489 /DNA_ORIENTATION=+